MKNTDVLQGRLLFVVTGCGRSGTGYMAKVMSEIGYACGHERVFNIYERPPFAARELKGDASWLAAPFVQHLDGTLVLHQVRHPVEVIRSFAGLRFFSVRPGAWSRMRYWARKRGLVNTRVPETIFMEYVDRFCPSVFRGRGGLERAIRYWVHWNTMVENAAAASGAPYLRYRVEDLSVPLLSEIITLLGRRPKSELISSILGNVPSTVNQRQRDLSITPRQIAQSSSGSKLVSLAERYGYDLDAALT